MPKLIVSDVDSRYDGEYDIEDVFDLTNGERIEARIISGIYPADLPEAFFKSDGGAAVALAVIHLRRAGKMPDVAPFLAAGSGSLRFDFTPEQEADSEIPPEQPPNGGSEPESATTTSAESGPSGAPSETSSETPTA